MMSIDIGALRQFEASWKPVLDSIPAVIEMSQQRNELEKAVEAKRKEFAATEQEIKEAYVEADRRLSEVNSQMEQAIKSKQDVLDETARLVEARSLEIAEAGATRKKTLAATEAKLAAVEAKLAAVEAGIAEKVAACDAEIEAKKAAAEAALAEVEAKRKAAESVLESLRAKLG
jgi:DNA repair exonuclease SbcCD ATPase subunit